MPSVDLGGVLKEVSLKQDGRSVSTDPRGGIGAEDWSATTTETRHISEKVAYDD
jgi:hypothetical protein